jgi:hypothetical protein
MTFTVTSTFTGAGTGTWTYVDDVSAQVALLTTQVTALNTLVTANLSPAGIATPGTPVAIWSAQADTLDMILQNLQDMHDRMEEMTIQQTNLEKRIEDQTKGMATMVHLAAEQATTAEMLYVATVKNFEFTEKTTNDALAAVGKPPTVVTPQAILDKIKANIQDLSIVKAEQNATNYIFTKINDTITAAYTTAETWYLSSAVGTFITEKWGLLKAKVKSLFGIKEAEKAVAQTRRTRNSTKAGNPPTLSA